MYGCACARIFIQSAWSNLCHIKSKCMIVSLCSWPIFLDSALLHCCYLDILAVLMMMTMCLLMHQSISWVQVLPHFSFSYLELCYKLTSHNFFKHFVCYDSDSVIRRSVCDFTWYSFVWIYQHGWTHRSRSAEGENSFYFNCQLHNIFVPFAWSDFSSFWEELKTWFITVEKSCWVLNNVQWFFFF